MNGPALDARGDAVVVAWYTAAGDVPAVRVAASADGGARFAAPVQVDAGEAVLGRVAIALGRDDDAWVAWLREDAAGQSLRLVRFDRAAGALHDATAVGTLAGRGRGTGFPQVALSRGGVHVVWTEVVAGRPRLRGAVVPTAR